MSDDIDTWDPSARTDDEVSDRMSRLKPPCYVPSGKLASEVCPIGSAGERTEDAIEDVDWPTWQRAMGAGFDAVERGGNYQDGVHTVIDPAVNEIKRQRALKEAAMAKTDCNCDTDDDRTDADDDDYDLHGNPTQATARRRAASQLGQPSVHRDVAAQEARIDDAPDDTDEDAAKDRLRQANAAAWRK